MNTVTFGNKNSYADFGLVLDHKEIGKPEPRTNYIDVPARDGHLDLTEAFGEVKYKERKLIFYFSYIGSDADWAKTLSALHNYINGQKLNIYFEKDYYWVGRCFVGDAQTKKGIREFTIECDCEPYKYKIEETIIDVKRKNLFDISKVEMVHGSVNVELGTITTVQYANWTLNRLKNFTDLEVGKTYVVHFKTTSPNNYILFSSRTGLFYNRSIITITEEDLESWLYFYGDDENSYTISDIQFEEGTNITYYEQYNPTRTIINDRKTVTPKITVTSGSPILSWTDKKTGASYQNALPSNFNNKILDFKFYEGVNTFTFSGEGSIKLTYREASL